MTHWFRCFHDRLPQPIWVRANSEYEAKLKTALRISLDFSVRCNSEEVAAHYEKTGDTEPGKEMIWKGEGR